VLRVECHRCTRIVEIQTADAISSSFFIERGREADIGR
jgi:hypothetical protein